MLELTPKFVVPSVAWDVGAPLAYGGKPADPDAPVPPIGPDDFILLGNDLKIRKEIFGVTVGNLNYRTIRHYDQDVYDVFEFARTPIPAIELKAKYLGNEDFIDQLARDGYLKTAKKAEDLNLTGVSWFDNISGDLLHSAPLVLEAEITRKCRRKCLYCAYNSSPLVDTKTEFGEGEWERVLIEAAASGVLAIQFTGGDPMSAPFFARLLKLADELKLISVVNSDLSGLDEETIDLLSRLKYFDGIRTSLDGPNSAIHDRMRGAGGFDAVVSGVRALVAAGIRVSAGMVLTALNCSSVRETAKIAAALGIDALHVNPVYKAGRAASQQELWPSESDLAIAVSQFMDVVSSGVIGHAGRGPLLHFADITELSETSASLSDARHIIATVGESIRVNSTGHFVTSAKLDGSPYYNLSSAKNVSILDCWKYDPKLQFLKAARHPARGNWGTKKTHAFDIRDLPYFLRGA
jgi:sulfatase maturation enzyme AslB (radical SAM superfamily)